MGIFNWGKKQPSLPNNIIPVMERFGRFEFDPQGSGEDAGDIWRQWAETVLPFAEADPHGFLVALAGTVIPVGGWAVYGASRTIWEYFSSKEEFRQHPSYKAIISAAIEFLRAKCVSLMKVRNYELDHWYASGGTRDTWLPPFSTLTLNKTLRSPEAWVEIGTAYHDSARRSEALAAYEHAIQLNPAYALAYSLQADVFTDLKRYEEALAAYDQALQLDSTDGFPYAGKGVVLIKLKRYTEALDALNHALQFEPTFVSGYVDKGDALFYLKRYEEALETYNKAIQLNSSKVEAYASKGLALIELKRYKEASEALDYALQLNPDNALAQAGKNILFNEMN